MRSGAEATWKLSFAPHRISCAADGTLYVAGDALLAKLDHAGAVVAKAGTDNGALPNARVSGIAATRNHVLASLGTGWSQRPFANVIRFDRDLKNPKEGPSKATRSKPVVFAPVQTYRVPRTHGSAFALSGHSFGENRVAFVLGGD